MKNLIDLYKTDKKTFKETVINKLYEMAKNNIEEKKKDIGSSILNYKKRD